MHLQYIHRMRGLAILGVVAVHCTDQLNWAPDSGLNRLLVILFQEFTSIFFMLAGFLFHHLSKGFDYRDYMLRKLQYVIIPFIVISAPGIAYLLSQPRFLENHPGLADTSVWWQAAFLLFYAGEQINYALWFMPVMITYFLMAPLFDWMIRRPRSFWVLAVLFPLALAMQRPAITQHQHFVLTVYYLAPYMLGMLISMNRRAVTHWVDQHVVHLALAFGAMVMAHYLLGDHVPTRFDTVFSGQDGYIDWLLIQKLILFLLMMGVARKWDGKHFPALDYLATVSFPVFFLHLYVCYVFMRLTDVQEMQANLPAWLVTWAASVGGSVLIAYVARLALRRNSRYLVGA